MPVVVGNPGTEIPLQDALVFPYRTRALPLETSSNRVLCFAIGLIIGVLTVRTEYIDTPRDLFSRIAPVDFLCLAFLGLLFLHHRMQVPLARSLLYASAIVLSLVPGLLFTAPDQQGHTWVGAAALLMAFAYYLIGLNIGAAPALLRSVLTGLCIGVFVQAIIVVHDTAFSHAQWFPDPMEGRARGTFKTNGQLGAYSFCAAGMLLVFGATSGSIWFRRMCTVLGLVAASFVFMASRRMGMLSMLCWGALFLVLGWKFTERRSYKAFLFAFIAAVAAVGVMWPTIRERTFVGQRFSSAVDGMTKSEGFIQNQARDVVTHAERWFPFGLGVGQGAGINPDERVEVHNGMLAVLVELGVLGLIGFAAMMAYPVLNHVWQRRSRDHQWLGVLLTTFMLISFLFIFHNTLARDRLYLLFLGIATTVVMQESRLDKPSVYFPTTNQDRNEE